MNTAGENNILPAKNCRNLGPGKAGNFPATTTTKGVYSIYGEGSASSRDAKLTGV